MVSAIESARAFSCLSLFFTVVNSASVNTLENCVCAHGHIGLSVQVQKWNRQDSEWHCIYVLIVARVVSAVSAWSCSFPKYFLGLRSFKVDFWGFSKLPIISSANGQFRV